MSCYDRWTGFDSSVRMGTALLVLRLHLFLFLGLVPTTAAAGTPFPPSSSFGSPAPVTTLDNKDPRTYHGGSCLVMMGRQCLVVAMDERLSVASGGGGPSVLLQRKQIPNLWQLHDNVLLALTGFHTDMPSLRDDIQLQQQQRQTSLIPPLAPENGNQDYASPHSIASLVSHLLYQRRLQGMGPYYVEPLIAGLDQDKEFQPFVSSLDVLGARCDLTNDKGTIGYACAGTAQASLYGTAQAWWKNGLSGVELVELTAKTMQSALERDCQSGYGIRLWLLEYCLHSQQVECTEYHVEMRQD